MTSIGWILVSLISLSLLAMGHPKRFGVDPGVVILSRWVEDNHGRYDSYMVPIAGTPEAEAVTNWSPISLMPLLEVTWWTEIEPGFWLYGKSAWVHTVDSELSPFLRFQEELERSMAWVMVRWWRRKKTRDIVEQVSLRHGFAFLLEIYWKPSLWRYLMAPYADTPQCPYGVLMYPLAAIISCLSQPTWRTCNWQTTIQSCPRYLPV